MVMIVSPDRALDETRRMYYKQKVYDDQKALKLADGLFPSQMSGYITKLTLFNNNDTCSLLYSSDSTQLKGKY